jgi:SAM-dependent methyltransferase
VPWTLAGVELGDRVLEIGPGPGMTTDVLIGRAKSIDCIEVDPVLAKDLKARLANTNVTVRCGDATAMPYKDGVFSGVVAFTMLHHISSAELQDQLFAEVYRVLRPGGVFVGVDSRPSLWMKIVHVFDTMVPIDPDGLADRLCSLGFEKVEIEKDAERFRFSARRTDGFEDRIAARTMQMIHRK